MVFYIFNSAAKDLKIPAMVLLILNSTARGFYIPAMVYEFFLVLLEVCKLFPRFIKCSTVLPEI
jgi:hypothetical protein